VAGLGLGVEVDRGQPAHAGVDPVDAGPPASSAASSACPAATRSRAAGARASRAPPQATASTASRIRSRGPARVITRRSVVAAVWLSEDVDMVALPGVCLDR